MSTRNLLAIGGLAAVTALTLTGCDQNMAQGPAALQRDGTDLVVAVCEDIQVASVLLETWASGNGTPTETVLEATGSVTVQSGSTFSTREGLDGLNVSSQMSPRMESGDNFALQILASRSSDDDINATFTVGESGLSDSLWLHPDGRETADPCR